jgi:hypothetical protein
MEIPPLDSADALGLARENNRLLVENNELLKKMDRRYIRGFWVKLIWFAILIGLPILFYSYFINSYMSLLGLPTSGAGTSTSKTSVNAEQILDLLRSNQ